MLPSGSDTVTDGKFSGGNDTAPEVAAPADGSAWSPTLPIACDAACRSSCESYAFENPVNKGLCADLWGPGGHATAIVPQEACRRLYVDTAGRFPNYTELQECLDTPWGDVVKERIDSKEFVRINRRHWADRLKYDTESVSVERIYDMDEIVAATYQGRIAYDQFAALVSAHPVLTRRNATSGDRAEALFWTLLGRPPFGEERADVGRLFTLWDNNYYDHPQLGMRLPDAYIRYRCLDDNGEIDKSSSGECTSVTFGFEQLILKPDARADYDERSGERIMWSGLMTAQEWEKMQAPGRLMAKQFPFWENAVNVVIDQYLGYRLATQVPRVGEELVKYALANEGDIRAVHYAVLTSVPYRQSAFSGQDAPLRYTYGPLKQIDAEGWVDSMDKLTGRKLSTCDLRLNRPGDFLDADSPAAHALVADSEWKVNDEGWVDSDYRDLVRNLGGCPDNSQGGRFKIVSVLTTANQLNYATRLCNPAFDEETRGDQVSAQALLPQDITPKTLLDADMAEKIYKYQLALFFGRNSTAEEETSARTHGATCAAGQCTAEQFARPVCYALLSSSEMLFY